MKSSALITTLLLTAPLSVFAAGYGGDNNSSNSTTGDANTGGSEITLAGTGSNDKHFDHGSWGLSGSYGWFLDNNWEVVLRQSFNYADLPGANAWSGSTRIGADYHWNLGKWRPFLGVNIGGIYGNHTTDTGIVGPDVGVKYYVKPDTFVFLQTEYQYSFRNSNDVTDNFSRGNYAHTIGVGFNF